MLGIRASAGGFGAMLATLLGSGCFFELAEVVDPISNGGMGGGGGMGGAGGQPVGGGGQGASGAAATVGGTGGVGATGGGDSAYAALVEQDGAIAHYRLDETEGAVAQDTLGNFRATLVGTVNFGLEGAIPAEDNTAFGLDGGGFTLGAAQPFDGSSSFSVEAWVKPNGLTTSTSRIFDMTDQVAPNRTGHTLFIRNDGGSTVQGGYERWVDGSISCHTHNNQVLADDTYSHVVLTFDGNVARLYYNSLLVVTSSSCATVPPLEAQFTWGRVEGGGSALIGSMDEAAIYPMALSQEQVDAHFAFGQR